MSARIEGEPRGIGLLLDKQVLDEREEVLRIPLDDAEVVAQRRGEIGRCTVSRLLSLVDGEVDVPED